MPEWLTHVFFALIIIELITIRYKLATHYKVLALIGAILPDIEKIFMFLDSSILAENATLQFLALHGVFHTVIGVILMSLVIAFFWRNSYKLSFLLILLGSLTHILLDTFSTGTGIMWLWPLSWQRFGIGIYWSDWLMLPVVSGFWLLLILFLKTNFSKIK